MSEFCFLTDELIAQQLADRAAAAERSRYPGERRPRGGTPSPSTCTASRTA